MNAAPLVVTSHADADTRLVQLHQQYADAKAASDEAAARLKAITDGIKAELNTIAPDEQKVQLVSEGCPTLQLTWVETWRFDSKRFKVEDPENYVRYATKSGAFQLRAIPGGGQ